MTKGTSSPSKEKGLSDRAGKGERRGILFDAGGRPESRLAVSEGLVVRKNDGSEVHLKGARVNNAPLIKEKRSPRRIRRRKPLTADNKKKGKVK